MGDLVPRDYYDPVPVKRQTRKELSRIEQQAIVKRAALEEAARDARFQLEARAQLGKYDALLKVNGSYDIAELATDRSSLLDHTISQRTQNNPGLELIQRGFEDTAALVGRMVIYSYGTER
jgi:hypothetical protein